MEQANSLTREARHTPLDGDLPAAIRLVNGLWFFIGYLDAIHLLAEIHDGCAGRYAESGACPQRLRTLTDEPIILYNIGLAKRKMGLFENVVAAARAFLNVTAARVGPS